MLPEEILSRLRAIIYEVFKDDAIIFSEALSMDDVPSWDSIGHMMLISTVEKAFNIQCTLVELINVDSVGTLVTLVEKKLQHQ